MRSVFRLGVLACVLVPLVAAVGRAADEDKLSGTYKCSGTWNGGKSYGGTVTVKKRGDSYTVDWDCGGEKYSGVGILDGESFSVNFTGEDQSGVYLMTRGKSGDEWSGKWVRVKGLGLVHKESWKKQK